MRSYSKFSGKTLDDLGNRIAELNDTLNYKQNRPLIRLDKGVMLTLYIILDLAFKSFVVYKML